MSIRVRQRLGATARPRSRRSSSSKSSITQAMRSLRFHHAISLGTSRPRCRRRRREGGDRLDEEPRLGRAPAAGSAASGSTAATIAPASRHAFRDRGTTARRDTESRPCRSTCRPISA